MEIEILQLTMPEVQARRKSGVERLSTMHDMHSPLFDRGFRVIWGKALKDMN